MTVEVDRWLLARAWHADGPDRFSEEPDHLVQTCSRSPAAGRSSSRSGRIAPTWVSGRRSAAAGTR